MQEKSVFLKLSIFSFVFYLFSIPVSMGGMEIFSWLSVLLFIIFLFTNKSEINKKKCKELLGYLALSLGFFSAVMISGIGTDISQSDRTFIVGEARWVVLLAFFPLIMSFMKPLNNHLKNGLLFLVLVVSVYSIIQAYTGIDIFRSEPYLATSVEGFWRAKGFFTNTMTYSYSFSTLFVFLFVVRDKFTKDKYKVLFYLTMFFLALSLFLTFTRGAWVSIAFSLLVYFILTKDKSIVYYLLFLGAIFLAFSISSQTFRERLESVFDVKSNYSNLGRIFLWRANWEIFKKNPVFGVGWKQSKNYLDTEFDKMNAAVRIDSHAHNNYLSVLSCSGVVGIISYLIMIFFFLFKSFDLWRKENGDRALFSLACLIGLINFHVGGLTETNLFDGEVLHLQLVLMSIILYMTTYKNMGMKNESR